MFSIKHENHKYNVEFKVGFPMRFYHPGKSFPKTTQCIIEKNGLAIGFGQVIKHEYDRDNLEFALKISMKKALNNSSLKGKGYKELRTILWKKLNEYYLTIKTEK